MELRVIDYVLPKYPQRTSKCSNAFCYATPAWSIAYKEQMSDEPTYDYVCNNHLIDFITSRINNMRIRLQ